MPTNDVNFPIVHGRPTPRRMSNPSAPLAMRLLALALTLAAASAAGAEDACAASPATPSLVDITATIDVTLPTWEKPDGLGADHRTLSSSHENGDVANVSELRFCAHTGTHVDAPRHFSRDDPTPIERLPLEWMNGPALVVDAFDVPALDAASLDALHLPRGVSRVIFRTDNTRRDLMRLTPFHEDYVGFTEDGARWLVDERPEIRAVGVDYVSVAAYEHLVPAHVALLDVGVVPIEGLVVPEETVRAGWWHLHCAPLKIAGSDGAPARAWLTPL